MRRSIAAPNADWPPSISHWPGVSAEKCGPQTASMKRGSSDTAMQLDDVPRISASRRRGSPGLPSARAPSVPSAPACASISPAPTGVPGSRPIAAAASAVSPCASGVPGDDDLRAEPGEAVGVQGAKADAVEELARPALLMRQIAELAGDRAQRARQRPGRAKREPVGEAEEMRRAREGLGLRPREPDELRRLHLGRKRAAEVAQDLMAGGVDPRGVLGRAMIHPHDHVALGRAGGVDRQRLEARVERDERTGRCEANSGDRLARQAGRLDRLAHRFRHRAPDVGGRLLDDVAGLAPDRDRPPGAAEEPARRIENARAGAARADIHSDKTRAHDASAVLRPRAENRPFRPHWQAAGSGLVARPPPPRAGGRGRSLDNAKAAAHALSPGREAARRRGQCV